MVKERFETLDGMRGVAAILVMLHHFYMRFDVPCLHNTFIAVDFFFILSGFVIMHAYGGKLAGGMAKSDYLGRRIIRLYPLMAAGLLLGGGVQIVYARLGHSRFLPREIFAATITNLGFLPYLNDKGIDDGAHTLQSIVFPADAPLWSVFFELVASGCFIWLCRLSQAALFRLCLGALALTFAGTALMAFATYNHELWVGCGWGMDNFLGGFPRVFYGFSCGMLLYQARRHLGQRVFTAPPVSSVPGVLLLYLLLAGVLLWPFAWAGAYYLFAIILLAPGLVMWGGEVNPARRWLAGLSRGLGWISYPLYCLHTPVLFGVYVLEEKSTLLRQSGLSPQLCAIIATLALSLALGFLDLRVRKWLGKRLDERFKRPGIRYRQPTALNPQPGFAEGDEEI